MKLWVKILLGTVTGFAGGFASGFFFHKKLNDVEFEEIDKEEMALLEKQVEAQKGTVSEAVSSSLARVESVQDLPDDPDKMRLSLQGKVSYIKADHDAKDKYSKIWGTVREYSDEENANELPIQRDNEEEADISDMEEGFDDEFLEMIENEQVEPGQVEPPHKIELWEFYNERSEYDKITIDWYEPDTFVDEKEEIIADLKTYIGDIDIHKLFERVDEYDDPDIRFVRNEQYGTDYEIVRHHRSWKETTGEE